MHAQFEILKEEDLGGHVVILNITFPTKPFLLPTSIFSPLLNYLYPCLITTPKLCASQVQGPWLTYWYPHLESFSQQMLVE